MYWQMPASDLHVFLAQVSPVLSASHYAVVLEIYFCQRTVVFLGYLVIFFVPAAAV